MRLARCRGIWFQSRKPGPDLRGLAARASDVHVPGVAIAEQALGGGLIVGHVGDQVVANSGHNWGVELTLNHWLVIHRY